MRNKAPALPDRELLPSLAHESLYLGVDIGKKTHVAGFISSTLLTRYQRFEHCPALTFDNSREGFRALIDRIKIYVPLTQVYAVVEVTGQYHRALLQYLEELDIPVYIIHVQKRQQGLLKTDKRDALGLANLLYNQLEKGNKARRFPASCAQTGSSNRCCRWTARYGAASRRPDRGEYTAQKQTDSHL